MGAAIAFFCAAACCGGILWRIQFATSSVPSLRFGRFSLSDRTLVAAPPRTNRSRFVRQSSGLGHSAAEMGLRRLDQPCARVVARPAHCDLGLRKFRMLVAAQYFRESQ